MKILLLRGFPQKKHVVLRRKFIGPEYDVMAETLAAFGVDIEQCYIDFAGPYGGKLSQAQIRAYNAILAKKLAEIQPDKILVLGAEAYQIIRNVGYTHSYRVRGMAWMQKCGDHFAYTVACLNPQEVVDEPELYTDFYECVHKLVNNDQLKPPPRITQWTVTPEELEEAYTKIIQYQTISFDLETTGLDPITGKITAIGLCVKEKDTFLTLIFPQEILYTAPVCHRVKAILEALLTNNHTLVAHNAKFDLKWLAHYLGKKLYKLNPRIHDTMLMHYVIDERTTQKPGGIHGLKMLAQIFLDAEPYGIDFKDSDYADKPEILHAYLSKDVVYTYLLFELFQSKLTEMGLAGEDNFYAQILIPATIALADIELTGVMINAQHLSALDRQLVAELQDTTNQIELLIREIFPELLGKFNPGSPEQVMKILRRFEVSDLIQSTSKENLLGLAQLYKGQPVGDFCNLVLKYRDISKVRSTYVTPLIERSKTDGRVRTNFNLNGTATGRLSSNDPNLQNIPRGHGAAIRNAFIAPDGYKFINADYSQLEIRVAALLSKDQNLILAYRAGRDIHRETASRVFGVAYESVTSEQRTIAKRLVFGIMYGISAYGMVHVLAEENIQVSVEESAEYIENFLAGFEGYTQWRDQVKAAFIKEQQVVSHFGRIRRWPYLNIRNNHAALKEAINFPIQSAASDICLNALIRLHPKIEAMGGHILFTVHDSISFEIPDDKLDEALELIKTEMQRPLGDGSVPLVVDVKIGDKWE